MLERTSRDGRDELGHTPSRGLVPTCCGHRLHAPMAEWNCDGALSVAPGELCIPFTRLRSWDRPSAMSGDTIGTSSATCSPARLIGASGMLPLFGDR